MKKPFLLLVILAALSLTSFTTTDHSPVKKTAKRCGPWFTVYNTSSAVVSSMQLIYVPSGYTITVVNPVFPYSFPQGGNGDYKINVTFSSVPATGVYVGANDYCVKAVNKYASLTFPALDCSENDIRITNFACL